MAPSKNFGLFKIPFFARFLMQAYFAGLFIFFVLRAILLLYADDKNRDFFQPNTAKAFLIGAQFDSVVLAYILAMPLVFLSIQTMFSFQSKVLPRMVSAYFCLVFPVAAFIAITDIPYFDFFRNRISEAAFQWLGNLGIVLGMLLANWRYAALLAITLFVTCLLGFGLFLFTAKKLDSHDWATIAERHKKGKTALVFLCLALPCFLGMRGKIARPIRQGDAFFCNDLFLNQIGLNPVYTLMKSLAEKVKLMDDGLAIKNTQQILKIEKPVSAISPIAHEIVANSVMQRHNIVLVIMESMSADYMATFGNRQGLTPTLDSLAKVSWFFEHAFSAGIHTNNGVFSSLYAFPALKRIRPLSTVPIGKYSGLPFTLKENGYRNLFFSTHSEVFDNLGTFLPINGFDELFSAEDYPPDRIVGPFGVPDDYLFSFAKNKLDQTGPSAPFFAAILTTSNHEPYILPDYFKTDLGDKKSTAVRYSDWAIQRFLSESSGSPWFDNTIFAFVADHGQVVGESPYDIQLSYNHVPLILYSPKILGKPHVFDQFIGQIDLFPTIMGILNGTYLNNTLGVDALAQKRDCIYFSADDKLGCLDDEWLFIHRFGGGEGLYRYKTGSTENMAEHQKVVFERLKSQALSQTQAAEWMISNAKTSVGDWRAGQ